MLWWAREKNRVYWKMAARSLNALRSLPHSRRMLSSSALVEKTHATIKGRKRFYKLVGVRGVEGAEAGQVAYEVTLDGRPLRSPGRRPMHFESQLLASAVALEWDAQISKRGIEPATMPLMSLVSTWIDQTDIGREEVIRNVIKYLHSDTTCYYADPEMRVLVGRQKEAFESLHHWLADEWDAPLTATDGVFKVRHPPHSIARITTMVEALDTAALTALQCATMESKSLVIGLALVLRCLSPAVAEETSRLEEEFQLEQWGLVEGGHDLDRVAGTVKLTSTAAFLHLLDGTDGHSKRLKRLRSALEELEK